jgi:pyruvate dehydrogenase E2 component (dihydrolipoamide acetyltransferase)
MDVLMPQLGETVAEGKISKWFVSAGDAVKPGDNLFEIETDKVSMEVPAISAGTLAAIHVQAGEIAPVGAVVAVIQGKGEVVSPQAQAPPPLIPAKAGIQKSQELGPRFRGDERKPGAPVPMEPFREVRSPERNYGPARLPGGTVVTPLARRLAGEAGIDLANLKGSGPHGRIVARDVETALSAAVPTLPQAQAAAQLMLMADVALDQVNSLLIQVPPIDFFDVIIKAWAAALQLVIPSENTDIAISAGASRIVLSNVASKSLTAIAAARGSAAQSTQHAPTGIFIPTVADITLIAPALEPAQSTLLSIGADRRAPVEAEDGAVKFIEMMIVTLSCDPHALDATLGAKLLSAFKGFVERPVTMIV